MKDYGKIITVLAVLFVTAALALYDGNDMGDLDNTRPPDTGEAAAYGAAAIREVKRAIFNGVGKEHYINSSTTYDGTHKTNFFRAYMAGSNSINGASIQSNSIPSYAYGSNSIPATALQSVATGFKGGLFLSYTTSTSITSVIKWDNSIPQISEGFSVWSTNYTPVATNSILIVEANMNLGANNGRVVMALFRDNGSNAVAATGMYIADQAFSNFAKLRAFLTVTNAAAIPLELRVGVNSGTGYINSDNGGAKLGGVGMNTFSVMEVVP